MLFICDKRLCSRIAILIFLAVSTGAAQIESRIPRGFSLQVNGQVRYGNSHQPAENVLVRIENFSGGLVSQVLTDRTGKFTFSGLNPIQYVVTVHAPGYVDSSRNVNLATSNSEYLNFEMIGQNSSDIEPKPGGAKVIDARVPADAQAEYAKAAELLNDQRSNKSAEARSHLEKAVKIFPEYLEAQIMLGLACMNLKDWANAEKALHAALAINKDASTAYFALGEVYLRQKKYSAAEETLKAGLKLKDDAAAAHLTLARVYWESAPTAADPEKFKNLAENAWREVNRALQLDPNMAEAHLFAGNLLLRARRPADALKHYEQYLVLAPDGEFAAETRKTIDKIKASLKSQEKN